MVGSSLLNMIGKTRMREGSLAKKKSKIPSLRSLKKQADILWSKIIHAKWQECCAVCNSSERPQAHHFRSRRFSNTRWNTDNGILLCSACHFGRAHRDYEWIRREFEKIHGKKMIDHLWKESQKIIKVDREFLEKTIERLKREL
jgi:ribosomal protein L37E